VVEGKAPHDVLLAYLHGNQIAATFSKSLIDLMGYDLSHNARIGNYCDIRSGTMGLPEARNSACSQLLELGPDKQWLFFVDSDMGFEPNALDLLIGVAEKHKLPIVAGLAFAQREAISDGRNGFRCFSAPTIYDWMKHEGPGTVDDGLSRMTGRRHYPVNTLLQCHGTGGACILIHRSVLQAIKDAYGETWFNRVADGGEDLTATASTHEIRTQMGEDMSFSYRVMTLGIPLYVHTGIRFTHFKNLWVAEEDFWTSFIAPPATERVDVIVPVLHRPQNVKTLMESLTATTGLANAYFVCESGDTEEIAEVKKYGARALEHPGTFAEKVNWAYDFLTVDDTWTAEAAEAQDKVPWILLVGDDVRFRPGWLDQAMEVARRYNGEVIGTNDLANSRVMRGEHATHMLIRRDYIDKVGASWDGPGIVCHPYHHWYVDDEIVCAAMQRNVFQSALGSQVEHMHPLAGKAELDDVYRLGEAHVKEDQAEFESRARAQLGMSSGQPNRATRRQKQPQPVR
jgi:glycosyltransferase involved in cell wall biosynthesis